MDQHPECDLGHPECDLGNLGNPDYDRLLLSEIDKNLELRVMIENLESPESSYLQTEDMVGRFRRKYSTTSSLYVKTTLHCPAAEQQLLCISAIIQGAVCDNVNIGPGHSNAEPIEFEILPSSGSDIEMMDYFDLGAGCQIYESMDMQEEMRQCIAAGQVPPLMEIMSFLHHLYRNTDYAPQCNILALVYMNRMSEMNGIRLSKTNWRMVWLSVISIAGKVWDDCFRAHKFIELLPQVSKSQLTNVEKITLSLIRWNTTVKPKNYAVFYFELRAIFTEITHIEPTEEHDAMMALSTVQARRIEAVTTHSTTRNRMLSNKKSKKERKSKSTVKMGESLSSDMLCASGGALSDSASLERIGDSLSAIASPLISKGQRCGERGVERGNNTLEDVTRRREVSRMVLS